MWPDAPVIFSHYDTDSYLLTYDTYSLDFPLSFIGYLRTPVYPLLLGLVRDMTSGATMYIVIDTIQWTIFLISIWYFFRLADSAISNQAMTLCLTAIYAIYPGITINNMYGLTESLSISGLTFFMYFTGKALYSSSAKPLLFSSLWLIFLLMLKPAFIYLLPLCIAGWCIVYRIKRHVSRMALRFLLLPSAIYIIYICCFNYKYGYYSVSVVSDVNDEISAVVLTHGFDFMESRFQNDIFPLIASAKDSNPDSVKAATTRLHEEMRDNRARYSSDFYKFKKNDIRLFFKEMSTPAISGLDSVDSIPLSIASVCVIIFILAALIWGYQHSRIPLISLLISGAWTAHVLTNLWGAPADYDRLMVPVFPLFLIMAGKLMENIILTMQSRLRHVEFK